jgi:hypothetical protein
MSPVGTSGYRRRADQFPLSMRERKSRGRVELRGTILTESRLTEAEDGPREAAKKCFRNLASLQQVDAEREVMLSKKMRSFRSRKAF